MSFQNYLSKALLDHCFGKSAFTQPSLYVALSTTVPNDDGTNFTEPSTGAYARVSTAASVWGSATLANPAVTTNTSAITFPTATGNWAASANLVYVGIFDASSGGNLLMSGAVDVAKPVLSGDTASFAIGSISVTLT